MNKVISGKQPNGFYEAILGKPTNEYMQDMNVIEGNLYRNRLDGMYYSCIKSGVAQISPNSEFFNMNPVSMKSIFNTVDRNAVIKYFHSNDEATASVNDIALGDLILTLGSSVINDGGGSLYIVEGSLVNGFSIGNGKYANYLVNSAKTQATTDNSTKVATTAFVQAQKASPAFTGTPTAPTATTGTNTTQLATVAYANAIAGGTTIPAVSKATNGYMKLANGLIIQWGTIPAGGSLALPVAFPNAVLKIVGTSNGTSGATPTWVQLRVTCTLTTVSANGLSDAMNFIAIGY